jgi:hypothetical protein
LGANVAGRNRKREKRREAEDESQHEQPLLVLHSIRCHRHDPALALGAGGAEAPHGRRTRTTALFAEEVQSDLQESFLVRCAANQWLMSIPRSAKRSSTFRSDSGYRTYIITTRRITSGELLKYRNGLRMAQSYHGQRRPEELL